MSIKQFFLRRILLKVKIFHLNILHSNADHLIKVPLVDWMIQGKLFINHWLNRIAALGCLHRDSKSCQQHIEPYPSKVAVNKLDAMKAADCWVFFLTHSIFVDFIFLATL